MKKFLKSILLYFIVVLVVLELVIRVLGLTDDVPHRKIDNYGLQVYIEGQSGRSHGNKWNVNDYGFLGDSDIKGKNQLLVIGDSFIENFMNPNECRQSQLFKNKGYDVFEIGRSGITFIEALEFLKHYRPLIEPKKIIVYMGNSDLVESIKEIKSFNDRAQLSLTNNELDSGEIKGKFSKKILYGYKTLYYLYLKYKKSRVFQVSSDPPEENIKEVTQHTLIEELLKYSVENYKLENVLFVFRKTNNYKNLFDNHELSYLELNMTDSKYTFQNDSHWNCEGHKEANDRISSKLVDKNFSFH